MTKYTVHLYREMRLVFSNIEADSQEAAAEIARDTETGDADDITDCDGETLAALVDLGGDEGYEQSRVIDFDGERQRKAVQTLLAACRMVVERWERGNLAEAARACAAAIAEATATDGQPELPGTTHFEISEDEFAQRYPLVSNHLNPAASWGSNDERGCVFETYGEEVAFVRQQNPRTVWTLVDGDDGGHYVLSGFHLVNRIGYLVSKIATPEGIDILVSIQSEPDSDDPA